MNKIAVYFSHIIRGKKGSTASQQDMDENCEKAKKVASWLRENIPDLELYVPAEHEDFVQLAYLEKYLTEKQILDIDCKILEKRDLLIVFEVDGWRGGGIGVEIVYAQDVAKIPIFYLKYTDGVTLLLLEQMVEEILGKKGK